MTSVACENKHDNLGGSPAEFILALLSHDDLINDINDRHLDGDVRLRFPGLRYIRSKHLERKVLDRAKECQAFRERVKSGTFDAHTQDGQSCWEDWEEVMEGLDVDLSNYSRVYDQDRIAIQAPRADKYFLDKVVRYNMLPEWKAPRAPNGEPSGYYGPPGAPVDDSFIGLRYHDRSLFGSIIVDHLMGVFYNTLYNPLRRIIHNWRWGEDPLVDEGSGLGGRTLQIIEEGLECGLSVFYMAGSVVLSVKLPSEMQRIMVMSLMSLIFPFTVLFLSKRGQQIFMLCAAFWAVTIALVPTAGSRSQ